MDDASCERGDVMKKALALTALAVCVLLVSSVPSQEFSYVGAQKCQVCHRTERQGRQYPIWEESKHSKSFEALSKPEAAGMAMDAGVGTPPADTPACLKCHAPLCAKAPELKAEGVSCEGCHGPGSEYKKLSLMKNRDAAAKNGILLYGSPGKIKALCLKCHESAHGVVFDFDAAWGKIRHSTPKG
jgi:hypothetical protein